jgi:hypothetical protein
VFSQEYFFKKFLVALLTNAKMVFQKTRCRFAPKRVLACGSGFMSVQYSAASGMPAVARPTGGNAGVAHDEFAACVRCFQGCLNAHDLQ